MDKAVETTDRTIAASMAGKNPAMTIPLTNQAAIYKTTAFTTKANNPKVKTVNGKVNITSIGLMTAFITPRTIAAKIAVSKLDTEKPGTIREVIIKARAFKRTFKINFITYSIKTFLVLRVKKHKVSVY